MVYSVWSKCLEIHHMEYAGDMIFFKLLGQPFLLLGSAERAHDLFEKRSSNYSDRPRFPMFNEVSVTPSVSTVSCVYQGLGWVIHGKRLSFHTGWSGEATVAPSMSISIRKSFTSIIRFKSPRCGPFSVACSSLQMILCSISGSKRTSSRCPDFNVYQHILLDRTQTDLRIGHERR